MGFAAIPTRAGELEANITSDGHCSRVIVPGVFTIPLACAVSVLFLPPDGTARGALLWPAWILAAGMLTSILLDVLGAGTGRLFRAEHVLMTAIVVVVFAELLQPSYTIYFDSEMLRKEFVAIGLFATMLALGSSVRPPKLPRQIEELARRTYPAGTIFSVILLCWSLAMLNFAYASDFSLTTMINGLLGGRWSAPWGRGQLGGWDAFRDFLNYFGYLLPALTVLLKFRVGSWLEPRIIISIVCSILMLAFTAQNGSRRIIVMMLGSAMLTYLCINRQRLRPRHYFIFAALAFAIVLFLDIMLAQRNAGFGQFSYRREDFKGLRVDDNFRSLGETLRAIPDSADFVGPNFLWYVIIRPVPRVLWPGKPIGWGFDLAQRLGIKGLALTMSVIGEWYMSFGWIGIAVGGFTFGWLAGIWNQLLEQDFGIVGIALYGLGAMALFVGIRSVIELALMSYPILCWYAIDRLLGKSTENASRHLPLAFPRR